MKYKDLTVFGEYQARFKTRHGKSAADHHVKILELNTGYAKVEVLEDVFRGGKAGEVYTPSLAQILRPWHDVEAEWAAAAEARERRVAAERERHRAEQAEFDSVHGAVVDTIERLFAPYGVSVVQRRFVMDLASKEQVPTLTLIGDVAFAAWVVKNIEADDVADEITDEALGGSVAGPILVALFRKNKVEPCGFRRNVTFAGEKALLEAFSLALHADLTELDPLRPEQED